MYDMLLQAVEYAKAGCPAQAYQVLNEAVSLYENYGDTYFYHSFWMEVMGEIEVGA